VSRGARAGLVTRLCACLALLSLLDGCAYTAWVAHRLASELRAAGVIVHDAPHGSALRIEGTLLQFFTEPQPQAFTVDLETDIHVVLTATWPDGAVADKELYVKGVESSAAGNDAAFQASVNDASTHMSRDLLVSVLALLDRPAPPRTAGCARRVVIDPEEVHRHNTDWVLRRPVPEAPPAAAPAPTVRASDAGAPPRTI
jgi:hypothetical protein